MDDMLHMRAQEEKERIEKALPKGDGFEVTINESLESVIVSLRLTNQKAFSIHRPHESDEVLEVARRMVSEMAAAVGMRLVHVLGTIAAEKEQ